MRQRLFILYPEPWPRDGEPPAGTPPAGGLLTGDVTPPGGAGDPPPPADTPPAGDPPPAAPPAGDFAPLDKFKVLAADGSIDHKATLTKYHASYAALEKRVGTGDLPPTDPTGYSLEGHDIPAEQQQALRQKFHADGLTAKQASSVLEFYGDLQQQAIKTAQADHATALTGLKTEWGASYQAKLNAANYALATIGGAELAKQVATDPILTNNVTLLRLLAKVGEGLKEDSTAASISTGEVDELNSLVRSPAYRDSNHPDHPRTVQKVRAAMQRGWKPQL